MIRRWRGTIDVPLSSKGYRAAEELGYRLRCWNEFDLVIHDDLSRCIDTAGALHSKRYLQNSIGPRPWHMGPGFEGKPVDYLSISNAQLLIATDMTPTGGEKFSEWLDDWITFVDVMDYSYPTDRVAVVTHNRNIQTLYSHHGGQFYQKLYDVEGPSFLTVHVYNRGHIELWGGVSFLPGLYFIRHAETSFGA